MTRVFPVAFILAYPMANSLITPKSSRIYDSSRRSFLRTVFSFLAIALVAVAIYFINLYWPYRYKEVKPLLESVFASKIDIGHYHRTYFPYPGFVATKLTLHRNSAPNLPAIGSTRDLIVQGSWMDLLLLRKRVRVVDVKGLHIVIPPVGSRENHEDFPAGSSADFAGPSTVIEELRIHEAILDIMRVGGGRYSFPIRQLTIRNLQSGQAISYSVDMQNARPGGRIQASGKFGPLTPQNLGNTPVSGNFTFSPVNLEDVGGISGTLSAAGQFAGTLASIEADAKADTPNFSVGRGRPTAVAGSVQCTINGLNGDIVLHDIETRLGTSIIRVEGSIAGSPKVTNLDVAVTNGRPQDLLRPFLHAQVPIAGAVWLKGHARLGPGYGGAKFLQRLKIDGRFNVPAGRLMNEHKEQALTAFSRRAQGLEPTQIDQTLADASVNPSIDVLSSLKGDVKMRDGILGTRRLIFQIPGATADLNGSYDLHNKTVHLLGDIRMDSDISHITTGFKSLLLKPLAPFFKKGTSGAVIPIAITGGPAHYEVKQNLRHRK